MRNKFLIFILTSITVLGWRSQCFPLMEETHHSINIHIAQTSTNEFALNDYLRDNLGFKAGEEEIVSGIDAEGRNVAQEVFRWIGYGGFQEDRPGSVSDYILNKPTRSLNHFHNPLMPWSLAGLNDNFLGQRTGQSSVLWAQNPNQHIGGRWSWPDARGYFYIALTGKDIDGTLIAPNKTERDKYFAYTFRAIGQLMHLIQDASVPEHVRNDIHILPAYEAYVNKIREKDSFSWGGWMSSPITFDRSILNIPSADPSALVPISRIVDTDRYSGDNPDVTTTISNSPQPIGIAEYTNANFLSKDTMFETDTTHNFSNPRAVDTVTWVDSNNRTYIRKVGGGGDIVDHLAITSLLYSYRQRYFSQYSEYLPVSLDSECYKDYAQKLIPRAVGYSAGLLNYFFRGDIEITPVGGAYSFTSDSVKGFTKITLLARNTTSTGDGMTDGSIELVVRYKVAQEDPFQSYPVQTTNDFSYIVLPELYNIRFIPKDILVELTFDAGENTIIPLNATDVYLQIVYKGRLGNEDGAVAVGFKDISEPTPIDLFNNMDKVCINGIWYAAGSDEALAQVNPLAQDVYAHDIQDAYLKISSANNQIDASPSDFTFHTPLIRAGTLYRAFILSDYGNNVFSHSDYAPVVKTDERDIFDHTGIIKRLTRAGSAIKNQVDYSVENQEECTKVGTDAPCDIRYYPLFYPFRGKNIWGPAGIIIENPKYPENSDCSWESLKE